MNIIFYKGYNDYNNITLLFIIMIDIFINYFIFLNIVNLIPYIWKMKDFNKILTLMTD